MLGDEFYIREKITDEELFDKYLKKLQKSKIVSL